MQEFTFNFNKKLYRLEKLNDFCFKLKGLEPDSSLIVVSDLDTVWVANSKEVKFCPFCFKYRYLSWKKKQLFLKNQDLKTLDEKGWKQEVDDIFIGKLLSCIKKFSATSKRWSCFDISLTYLIGSFIVPSYDICKECNPRVFETDLNEVQGQQILSDFNQRLNDRGISRFSELKKFIFDDAAGIDLFFNTFKGSGLPNDFLKDSYLSTFLALQPFIDNSGYREMMCGGEDEDKELSQAKALMEFIERYAYNNISYNSQILKNVSNKSEYLTHGFIERYLQMFSVDQNLHQAKDLFSDYLVWGIDVLNNSKALLPLLGLFNGKSMLEEYGANLNNSLPDTSSSGFAAHFESREALKKSILELIERDAFVRWWMRPEEVVPCRVPDNLQSKFNGMLKALSDILGLSSIDGRLLLLKSPLDVPVCFAFISSTDHDFPPAMLVGAGIDFEFKLAAKKAIDELGVAVLNFIARFNVDPSWYEKDIDLSNFQNIKTPQDHIYLYHYSQLLPQLKFLDKIFDLDEVKIEDLNGPKNIEQLKSKMLEMGIDWYAIDTTPKLFKDFGVFVARSISSGLYPLYFGGKWPFALSGLSNLSVAATMPHCFP